jgi:integrase
LLLAVLLSLAIGARQGEILGLRWQDIDLDASYGNIAGDMTARLSPLATDRRAALSREAAALAALGELARLLEPRGTRGQGR